MFVNILPSFENNENKKVWSNLFEILWKQHKQKSLQHVCKCIPKNIKKCYSIHTTPLKTFFRHWGFNGTRRTLHNTTKKWCLTQLTSNNRAMPTLMLIDASIDVCKHFNKLWKQVWSNLFEILWRQHKQKSLQHVCKCIPKNIKKMWQHAHHTSEKLF